MRFGDQLRATRKRKFLSQRSLAACVGVTRQAVSSWEKNRFRPRDAHLVRLCDLFGWSIHEMEELCMAEVTRE